MRKLRHKILSKFSKVSNSIFGSAFEKQPGGVNTLQREVEHIRNRLMEQSKLLEEILHRVKFGSNFLTQHSTFEIGKDWASAQPIYTSKSVGLKNRSSVLEAYFENNGEGKGIWKWRHYFEIYNHHLSKFLDEKRTITMAEVGVYSGGSLGMWQQYFGVNLILHGVDIEKECSAHEGGNIHIHIGDQESREFWKDFRKQVPSLDILIDDGGHTPKQQMVTLEEMLPHIKPGGIYICEDIHGLGNEFFMFLMGILDQFNHYEWTNEEVIASTVTPFQSCYHSVHFYPYMVVIEKLVSPRNRLLSEKSGAYWQPNVF